MEEKICENCKNYYAHYIIRNVHLIEIDGHCGIRINKPNINRSQKGCEKWKYAGDREAEREECILKTIKEMK